MFLKNYTVLHRLMYISFVSPTALNSCRAGTISDTASKSLMVPNKVLQKFLGIEKSLCFRYVTNDKIISSP